MCKINILISIYKAINSTHPICVCKIKIEIVKLEIKSRKK